MPLQLHATVAGEPLVIPLGPGVNRVGRSVQPQFKHFPGVSRSHAEIVVQSGSVEIHDLGARNRTCVNGHPIRSQSLHVGDEVELGEVRFVLEEVGTNSHGEGGIQSSDGSNPQVTQKLRGTRLLGALAKLAEGLVRDDATDPACNRCLKRIATVFQFRSACLFLLDEVGQVELRCAHGGQAAESDGGYSRSMVQAVVRDRKPLLVCDTEVVGEPWESARIKGIRSAVAVPMLRDEEILGVIYLDQGDSHRPFNRRHLEELQILANLAAAKLHHCQSRIEMHAAAQIQRHMLRDRPIRPEAFDVATRLQPCRLVGGDFYETLDLPGGRYLYALGDVSGKGVAAALIMAETLATLRAIAGASDSPLQLMQELQALLAERLAPRSFVTLFLGVLDPVSCRFEYVNAGHEPGVLLQRNRPVEWLESTGPPVGMQVPVPMESACTRIPPGGLLGLWSDGITEAVRTRNHLPELYTRERLLQCLERLQEAPVAQVVEEVFKEVEAFIGDTHAQDDRTFLALRGRAETN